VQAFSAKTAGEQRQQQDNHNNIWDTIGGPHSRIAGYNAGAAQVQQAGNKKVTSERILARRAHKDRSKVLRLTTYAPAP
jgi:hypothetical protein